MRVHLLLDEQLVREVAPEIVAADLPPVGIAGLVGDALGNPGHDALDAPRRQLDQRFVVGDLLAVAVEVNHPLDLARQVGVPWLPASPEVSLPCGTRRW